MAANRSTFEKLQRDRMKKERKELKQQARQAAKEQREADETVDVATIERISPEKLMELVQKLTEDLAEGRIDQDEFDEQRLELMERLED